jgi:hypothetical protein
VLEAPKQMTTTPHVIEPSALVKRLLAAQAAADAVRGPTAVDHFQGESLFDYTADDGHTAAHHFDTCPYCRLRRLKRAYRRAVDPKNETADVIRSLNKFLERQRRWDEARERVIPI